MKRGNGLRSNVEARTTPAWAQSQGIPLAPEGKVVIAHHNVVGPGGVLDSSTARIQEMVGGKYTPRAFDHLMLMNGSREAWVYDPSISLEDMTLVAQLKHRASMAGLEVKVINNLNQLPKGNYPVVYKPYIRRADIRIKGKAEVFQYGLPPRVTNLLKDKATIHEYLMESKYAENTPNFVNCKTKEITKNGLRMVSQIRAMYETGEVENDYPLGLVIRAKDADGGFGSGFIKELVTQETINGKKYEKGTILFFPDGLVSQAKMYTSWESALQGVSNFVSENMDMKRGDGVVMTRLIDLQTSPGIMAVVSQGDVYAKFDWNGQYKEAGDTATTGTTTGNFDSGLQAQYLAQSQQMLLEVVSSLLSQENQVESVYAAFNMDLMIVGDLERKLWSNLQNKGKTARQFVNGTRKYNSKYVPRAYDPDKVLFAEFNPRDTNWTLAVKAVMQVLQKSFSVEEMMRIANGVSVQIVARDKWKLPEGVSTAIARAYFEDLYQKLGASTVGAFVRMPADAENKIGVIAWNNSGDANDVLVRAYQELPHFANKRK